jgi:hypothetical protein
MTMPGFSADASAYRATTSHRLASAGVRPDDAGRVTAALARSPVDIAIGDDWRRGCSAEGGSMRACCNRKSDDCQDDCGTESCRAHCKERGRQCRGELILGGGGRPAVSFDRQLVARR